MLTWFGFALALFLGACRRRPRPSRSCGTRWPISSFRFRVRRSSWTRSQGSRRKLSCFCPMVHGVEFLREGYFGSQITAHYDLAYMAIVNTVLTLFGLAQSAKVSRTVVPE